MATPAVHSPSLGRPYRSCPVSTVPPVTSCGLNPFPHPSPGPHFQFVVPLRWVSLIGLSRPDGCNVIHRQDGKGKRLSGRAGESLIGGPTGASGGKEKGTTGWPWKRRRDNIHIRSPQNEVRRAGSCGISLSIGHTAIITRLSFHIPCY